MEEIVSQGNTIFALYAGFAGVLLSVGYVYKLVRDYRDERKAPKLKFRTKIDSRKESNESHDKTFVASR